MYLKSYPTKRKLLPIILVVLILTPMLAAQASGLQLTTTPEYNHYVHTFINSEQGNYTVVEKPIFPVMINNSQIQIGQSWTIICPLQTGRNYHVYCYGSWVNTSAVAKTDYDIYVYDPQGNLESSHTQAAGLPENLGTTSDDPLFTPSKSGNYSFVIKNDERQSKGVQQATFMIIENLECDKWHQSLIEGKDEKNQPSYYTTWAYEFATNASTVELFVKVPNSLDMYEARLYLMNNAKSPNINSFPVPWESGLFGNVTASTGGYNFENEAYRGVAYASCEHNGQEMGLNYTTSNAGTKLYHVVLIGEEGSGTVELMLKTTFGQASLSPVDPPKKVTPNSPATVKYSVNTVDLRSATLSYTTDAWGNTSRIEMALNDKTCSASIPGQTVGTVVKYRVEAKDKLENLLSATGEYTVKHKPSLDILINGNITLGGNITLTGLLTPYINGSKVDVQFMSFNATDIVSAVVLADGSFTVSYQPASSGAWAITASLSETQTTWRGDSEQIVITVEEPPFYVKYALFIIIGLVAASAVGGVVWFLKFRNK